MGATAALAVLNVLGPAALTAFCGLRARVHAEFPKVEAEEDADLAIEAKSQECGL